MATRRTSRQTARRRPQLAHTRSAQSINRRPLRFEPLEDRRLLALVTVTTLDDSVDFNDGLTSLREAIFATNLVGGPDTIDFAAGLTAGGPATILLTQGELRITDSLTITGPGADLLTIDASGNDSTPTVNDGKGSRVFNIDDGTFSRTSVSIAALRVTGGDMSGSGGAIFSVENLHLSDMVVDLNAGSFSIIYSTGMLTIDRSRVVDNQASGITGAAVILAADLAVHNSHISGNSGAGINTAGDTLVTDTVLSNNGSEGLIIKTSKAVQVFRSTISGNRSEHGGIRINTSDGGTVLLSDSTISGNTGTGSQGGGGAHISATLGTTVTIDRCKFIENRADRRRDFGPRKPTNT